MQQDSLTGLYFDGRRVYQPTTGRFTMTDSASFAAGDANLYGYGGNSPTNRTDPSGLVKDTDPSIEVPLVDGVYQQGWDAVTTVAAGYNDHGQSFTWELDADNYDNYWHLLSDGSPIRIEESYLQNLGFGFVGSNSSSSARGSASQSFYGGQDPANSSNFDSITPLRGTMLGGGEPADDTWIESNKQQLMKELRDPVNIFQARLIEQDLEASRFRQQRMNDPLIAAQDALLAEYTNFVDHATFGLFDTSLAPETQSLWQESGIQGTASARIGNGVAGITGTLVGGTIASVPEGAALSGLSTGAQVSIGAGVTITSGTAGYFQGQAAYYAYQAGNTAEGDAFATDAILNGGFSILSGGLTIRQGMSWLQGSPVVTASIARRPAIEGVPDANRTIPHGNVQRALAESLQESGLYQRISQGSVNLSQFSGVEHVPDIKPDVMGLTPDGVIDMWEIISPSQTREQLERKLLDAWNELPPSMRGGMSVIDPETFK
jgi:RHS repeat-associated protein